MRALQGHPKARVSSTVTKSNPRPRKYASASERQAAYRARAPEVCFRAEPKTADTLDQIAAELDVSRADLLLSMTKFALTNHDWARFGLTHRTLPYQYGIDEPRKANPMKAPTPAQLAARERFAAMARSGAFKKKAAKARKAKANPAKKTVSQKISQLVHEGYPQKQAVAVALSEQRKGKVKRNPTTEIIESMKLPNGTAVRLQKRAGKYDVIRNSTGLAWRYVEKGVSLERAQGVFDLLALEGGVKRNPATGRKGSRVKLNPVKYRDIAKGVAPARVQYAVHMPDRPSYHAMAYFTKKSDALEAAQEVSDRIGKPVAVSRVQVHFGPL